jgi:hypothetical protein
MKLSLTVFLITVLAVSAFGAVRYVPAQFPTIQAAINASASGDTVLVDPGTYMENLLFTGAAIEVRSTTGPYNTFIDGGMAGSVVAFIMGEGRDTVLEGFTIMNGSGTLVNLTQFCGGGIFCDSSSPTIVNNKVIMNTVANLGGGIYCQYDASPLIEDNYILDNVSISGGGIYSLFSAPDITLNTIGGNLAIHDTGAFGGGIFCYSSPATITKNIVRENFSSDDGAGIACWEYSHAYIADNFVYANTSAMGAGGVDCIYSDATIVNNMIFANWAQGETALRCCRCDPIVTNNTLCDNFASGSSGAGGGLSTFYASPVVTNTILWNNTGPEIIVGTASNPIVTYCDVDGGWPGTGNINVNPLFVDQAGGDYHLKATSPCIDAGSNMATALPEYDLEDDPRRFDVPLVPDTGFGQAPLVDMGADEFHKHLYYTGDAVPSGAVKVKLVDLPGTAPVGLFFGSGVLSPPMTTMWGSFYLAPPWFLIVLWPIPASGVISLSGTLPAAPPAPYDLPMQAIIGNALTNLCVLKVR